jgi:hypothetical protein
MPTDSPLAPLWELILDLCNRLLETCQRCTTVVPFGARADDPQGTIWTFYNFDESLLCKLRTLVLTHASATALPQSLCGVDWQFALDPNHSLTHPYIALHKPERNRLNMKPDEEERNRVIHMLRDHAATAWADSFKPLSAVATRPRRYEWLARAMLLVKEHADWSDSKIAREVGVNKSQLTRSWEYQAGAGLARGQKQAIPRGSKNGLTGELEAAAEPRETD